MIKADNTESTLKLRKHQDTLITVGKGIITFTIWSLVKTVSTMVINREELTDAFRTIMSRSDAQAADAMSDLLIYTVVMFIMLFFILIDVILRVYVGKAAIREGCGGKKGVFYLVLTFLMILASISMLISYVRGRSQTETDIQIARAMGEELSVSVVVIELTSLAMMIEMFYSACYVRKHRARSDDGREARNAA
jgi:magnesium-transporting ATPase (P-type)